MIAGIGVDSIEILRIEKALQQERFKKRIYTIQEMEYCDSKGKNCFQSYAGIYAAKEAAVKALGSGFRGYGPDSVEIYHDEQGAPYLKFLKQAQAYAEKMKITEIHLSISHDQTKAIAFVVLEKEAGV